MSMTKLDFNIEDQGRDNSLKFFIHKKFQYTCTRLEEIVVMQCSSPVATDHKKING